MKPLFSKTNLKRNIDVKRKLIKIAMFCLVFGLFSISFLEAKSNLSTKENITLGTASTAAFGFLGIRQLEVDPPAGGGNLTEEQLAFMSVIKTQTTDLLKTLLKEKLPDEDALAFKNAIADIKKAATKEDLETVKQTLKDLGLIVEAVKQAPNGKEKSQTISAQVKEQLEANKAAWEDFKAHKTQSFKIEIKAATMLESTNLGGSAYLPQFEIVPGVTPIARAQAFLENYCNSSNTNKSVVIWVNKVNPSGTVIFTSEGGVKPLIDFNFATETSTARKAPGKLKVSTEMLDDIDFLLGEIEGELRFQVDKAVDDALLAGNGVAPNLKGVTTYAGGFVLTSIGVSAPNNYDAIRAAATQVISLNFMPDTILLNPIDAANMELTKDTLGQYVFPPFSAADGTKITGMRVVQSNKVVVGSCFVGDMTKYIVRNYKAFAVEFGWVNDDFEKNLVTIIAERRLHAYMSNNNLGAFVYDTFNNIKTAITPAP